MDIFFPLRDQSPNKGTPTNRHFFVLPNTFFIVVPK